MEMSAYTQKLNQEFLSKKMGQNYAKKQFRFLRLVPIMLFNHREQACGVSIHTLQ
jgi:hypothetical protein